MAGISNEIGKQLQLRSTEPYPKPQTVTLMTVHGAKDRGHPALLSEPPEGRRERGMERRNSFVAITRAKESVVLSRASRYRGCPKQPFRFRVETGLVQPSFPL